MKQSQFDQDMIKLFEIKKNNYSFKKSIKSVIDFDSINQLNLLSYFDKKGVIASVEDLNKMKKFSDIYRFLNKRKK